MIKKTITYENFNGEQETDDFWFHLSVAEITKMELSADGNSMSSYLKRIAKANNGREIINVFEEVISKAYGIRSEDGRKFVKTPEAWAEFVSCGAWDSLFMELISETQNSIDFFNGLVPQKALEEARARAESDGGNSTIPEGVRMPQDRQGKHAPSPTVEQVPFQEPVEPPVDLGNMSDESFRALIKDRRPEDLSAPELREVVKRGIQPA